MLVITSLCCEHECRNSKDLNTNKNYGGQFSPKTGRVKIKEYSSHSQLEVTIFFKKQFRIYNYQESCQPGSVARMKLQQEFVSVHIWTRLTEGCLQFLGVYMRTQPKYCSWVFTFGTSPVTAPLPYFAPSINSTLAKFQPLQWVFTCGPSPATTLITSS